MTFSSALSATLYHIFSFPCFSPRLQSEGNDRQKNSALPSVPSLLEVLGFSYFYGGFLVGPQFTLLRYQQLVNRELTDCRGKPPSRSETLSDIAKSKMNPASDRSHSVENN